MKRALAMCCGMIALVGAGCSSDPSRGYSFTTTHQTSVRSIAVPVFDNRSFQKGIEIDLTDAIIKEIQRTTPWVVTSEAGAQTTLTGTITDASLRNLSTNSKTGYVQEMAVELTVDFDWRDGRTGQYLASRRAFKSMEGFVPARPTNERIELGQHAVVQEMARQIVAELRSGW